jgi:delta8-fatty-acid desaturase
MPPNKQQSISADSLAAVTASESVAENGVDSANSSKFEIWREDEGKSLKVLDFYPSKSKRKPRTDLTMAEVSKHNTQKDAWIVVDGHCYDVTQYIEAHPGGWLPIANLAGKDVTDAFANYHPARVYKQLLPRYYIGEVADYEISDFVKGHRALRQQLLERNLFETNLWFYGKQTCILAVVFAAVFYLALVAEQRVLSAILLGGFWQQLAFIGHDVGHNSISHKRNIDSWWGAVLGNLTGGISLAWWKRSHNVHHIVCNSVENDPDIQHIPLIAVTEKQFKPFWSTYHQKKFNMTSCIARFLIGNQHWLLYPVMPFARFNLYFQSWFLLCSAPEKIQNRAMEVISLAGFALWLSGLVLSFPTWLDTFSFLMISHSIAAILHIQIMLSHFYMDTYHGRAYNDDSDEWFTMQLKTTMNVSCPEWLDWFHGGLQFQIEHHLWPRLPRHNLRQARKLVIPFCKKHGIPYHEPGFIQGNIEMIRSLRRVALAARDDEKFKAAQLYDSGIWDALNARG